MLEKSVRRLGDNWGLKMLTGRTARSRDGIVDAQGDTKTVEARAEIGSARRNADGNLLHK